MILISASGGVFRALSNIFDGAFLTIFVKSSILDACRGSEINPF